MVSQYFVIDAEHRGQLKDESDYGERLSTQVKSLSKRHLSAFSKEKKKKKKTENASKNEEKMGATCNFNYTLSMVQNPSWCLNKDFAEQ
jgi:hypothetical protein